MSYCYFFSYGSNLLLDRIKARTPSVEVVRTHQLFGFRLEFNKLSEDGSTKANLIPVEDNSQSVWGVIQRIKQSEKPDLDRFEGLGFGYDYHLFSHAEIVEPIGYYISRDSKYQREGNPYDWYLNYVRYGAIENNFPEYYINALSRINSDFDNDSKRRTPHDKVLKKYGMNRL